MLRVLIGVCDSGQCGLFGKGGLIMYDVTNDTTTYQLADLPIVILLGIIGGVLGSLYNFLMLKVLRIYGYINEYVFTFTVSKHFHSRQQASLVI